MKLELMALLRSAGHEVVDFGAHELNPSDDYPDFVIPLALAVADGSICAGLGKVAVLESSIDAVQEANDMWPLTRARSARISWHLARVR